MQAAKQAAWAEAGVIIDDLKVALVDANKQLCKERAARDQLEEDMKQSFMRSVCAINLEVGCCSHKPWCYHSVMYVGALDAHHMRTRQPLGALPH